MPSTTTFTGRSSTPTAMAPLSPAHKCITSRKRQRASAYQLISDDDEFAAEQLSLSEEELDDVDSCCASFDDATASGYASSCSSESSSSSSSSSKRKRRASVAQEISGVQSSVRLMEKQVALASASMRELRSLVQRLAAQRQQQSLTVQCT
ncbi:hypothetical protein Gpo141_00007204 [Globisporangium polare]